MATSLIFFLSHDFVPQTYQWLIFLHNALPQIQGGAVNFTSILWRVWKLLAQIYFPQNRLHLTLKKKDWKTIPINRILDIQVLESLRQDTCLAVRNIPIRENFGTATEYKLYTKKLNIKGACARWMPHLLSRDY